MAEPKTEFDELFPEEKIVYIKEESDDFSKRTVIFSLLAILIYTAVVLYFTWHDKFVPDSLTYSYYGTFSIELGALAGIRINKQKGGIGNGIS